MAVPAAAHDVVIRGGTATTAEAGHAVSGEVVAVDGDRITYVGPSRRTRRGGW